MADTSFVDNVITVANRIVSAWLNTVNKWTYWGRRPNYAVTTGSANAQVLTLETGSLYSAGSEADGDTFIFKAGFTNTGATTLNVLQPAGTNAAQAVQINGVALSGGEIYLGGIFMVSRLGSTWQLLTTQQSTSPEVCDFRLTLTSGLPVTIADVTAATTLYCTPYKGNRIALYDGTAAWNVRTSGEMSIAAPATTSKMYDVFCYDNAGVPTLELLAWTNDTTRATAIALQNGVYVKSGATTRRYIGSFRTTGVSGQTEDSLVKRYVWNYYNRIIRQMRATDGAASWTYTTLTWRQANANAANQLDFVIGVQEDSIKAVVVGALTNTNVGVEAEVSIGYDSTTAPNSVVTAALTQSLVANAPQGLIATFDSTSTVGRHILTWLEISTATGTTTWYGTNARTTSGISGTLLG